jgi:hypothetical protein
MNLTKIEPESDSETPEPYSQFQFSNVHQKLMSAPVSFTEMKTEIKVSKVESDALQSHCESESAGLKQDLLCAPNYNAWKCENQMADILEAHEKMPNHHTVYCEPMNENKWFLCNKREKWKELMRQRRSSETPEQRQKRLNQMRLYARHRRANETPEQRQKRLSQMNMYARNRRANESLDQRVKRLMQMNNYEKQRRANETPEQREERKRKRRELENSRRKRETPEEQQKCLIQMNKYVKQQQNERQFNQINNYAEQGRLSKTYEQEEEHRTQEKRK